MKKRFIEIAVKVIKLLAQSTGDFTREELKKDVKFSFTDKTKAEIAAAKGENNGTTGGGTNQGGGTNTGGDNTGGDNTGGDNTGGDNNGGGGNPGGGMDQN